VTRKRAPQTGFAPVTVWFDNPSLSDRTVKGAEWDSRMLYY